MNPFTLEILQTINDWQCGGDHDQKVRRGAALKSAGQVLGTNFRTCPDICYRQEAHEKDRTWQLVADGVLPETIAAWTTDIDVAKSLKGGVPPIGLQGVVFEIEPRLGQVVMNLTDVYAAPDFHDAVKTHASQIVGFAKGIGMYGDRQKEVVLEIQSLGDCHIRHYGGFASDRVTLATAFYGRNPYWSSVYAPCAIP